ncbi:hypothetical protein V2G26_020450 [Clonostachys chloroleuca]
MSYSHGYPAEREPLGGPSTYHNDPRGPFGDQSSYRDASPRPYQNDGPPPVPEHGRNIYQDSSYHMSDNQVPLPPSRSAHGGHNPYNQGGGGHPYEYYGAPGVHGSQPSSVHSFAPPDPYVDDPYQGYSSSTRSVDRRLGEVNPDEIADDGDDVLHHPMPSKRNSMLSSAQTSDRGQRGLQV